MLLPFISLLCPSSITTACAVCSIEICAQCFLFRSRSCHSHLASLFFAPYHTVWFCNKYHPFVCREILLLLCFVYIVLRVCAANETEKYSTYIPIYFIKWPFQLHFHKVIRFTLYVCMFFHSLAITLCVFFFQCRVVAVVIVVFVVLVIVGIMFGLRINQVIKITWQAIHQWWEKCCDRIKTNNMTQRMERKKTNCWRNYATQKKRIEFAYERNGEEKASAKWQ